MMHNDSQHYGLQYKTQHSVQPSICYDQDLYTKHRFTECHDAECYVSLALYKIGLSLKRNLKI